MGLTDNRETAKNFAVRLKNWKIFIDFGRKKSETLQHSLETTTMERY